MFITLIVLLTLIALLGVYVIRPLLQPAVMTSASTTLGSEEDLRRLLTFRDHLLGSLVGSVKPADLSPEVSTLSRDQALQALIRVCEILKHAGMPYLPETGASSRTGQHNPPPGPTPGADRTRSPSAPAHLIVMAFAAAAAASAAGAVFPEAAQAQDAASSRMPPLVQQPDGTALAQIHQFILSPDQGQLRAYYLSLYFATDTSPVKVRIPSPDHATEFDFSGMNEAILSPDHAGQPPVLEMTPEPGINQIRGTFLIAAFSGAANWKSSFFQTLPGVTLIILPEYGGVLQKIFGESVAALNIWPPRITTPPSGFEFRRTIEQPNERDPNFSRMKNPPEQHSLHYFRRGDATSPYPEFQVTGVAASRTPGELIVVFFGMMLMGIALFSTFRAKARAGVSNAQPARLS